MAAQEYSWFKDWPGEKHRALANASYTRAMIAAMTPVAERQNRHSGDWYPLYKVKTEISVPDDINAEFIRWCENLTDKQKERHE